MEAHAFNSLVVGAAFTFAGEEMPGWQGARGPWVKVGARSYRALADGYAHGPTHVVGSRTVKVWKIV